ncbi:MAG: hypothetical protein J6S67_16380 [Methanobrevibacter sp.]|nr:hypothetical protein [Methanobrevibacter sp.]
MAARTNKKEAKEEKRILNNVAGDATVVLTGQVMANSIRVGNGVQSFRLDVAMKTPNGKLAHSFISCKYFGSDWDITEGEYLMIQGYIQTGSYDGKNGKVYTTDVVCEKIDTWEV